LDINQINIAIFIFGGSKQPGGEPDFFQQGIILLVMDLPFVDIGEVALIQLEPDAVFAVLEKAKDLVSRESILYSEGFKLAAVIPAEAGFSAQPQEAIFILEDGVNGRIGETILNVIMFVNEILGVGRMNTGIEKQ
jgi:hypothetical protein